MQNPDDIFYQAYVRQDRSFEGIFFLAVRTTGVVCRPGCKAKTPFRENVEFFVDLDTAIEKGYRPCKKCKPQLVSGHRPDDVERAIQMVQNADGQRVSDSMLRAAHIDPFSLRRWFKDRYAMTFHQYQRQFRVGQAQAQIRNGAKPLDTAYESGYESMSGFHQSFNKITGTSPGNAQSRGLLLGEDILTPVGPMLAVVEDDGLCLLEFHDRKNIERQIKRVEKASNAVITPGIHAIHDRLQSQISEYFEGQRRSFDIPMKLVGTEFQKAAWTMLQTIPYAETWNYQQQATAMGKPEAVRAVATANANNALAILIPCHRVIARNGSLAGYAGGLWRKQYLIDLEAGRQPKS